MPVSAFRPPPRNPAVNPTAADPEARANIDSFSDRELLAEIAGDASQALLRRFGSLAAAVGGDRYELARIGGPDLVWTLAVIRECASRMGRASLDRRSVLSSHAAVGAYLMTTMAWNGREQFRVLFLDKKNQLIVDEILNEGSIDHAPVYPREVVRRALEVDASAVILAHNHPSGDPTPSHADIEITLQVIEACRALKIEVHDHMIIGRDGRASLKSLGLI
jgi:DNA repair protein RadC